MANITTAIDTRKNPPNRRRFTPRFFRSKIVPWLFILPITLLYLLVVIGPSLAAFYYSLTDWSGIGKADFIGLENFKQIITDTNYHKALLNNLRWLAIFVTIPFALSLIAASMLRGIKRGGMAYRTLLFLPYILPSVVAASIWRNLLSPRVGLGSVLAKMGIAGFDFAFLGSSKTALYAIAFVDNWHFWGYLMILFLAAMQAIPADLYDAAKVDGANRWQEFLNVTIPGIRPTLVFMIMMVAVWSFLTFDYIWILTQGGPARSSEVLSTYLYKQAFNRFEAGYASSIGLTMSLFAGMILGIFVYIRRRGWEV
jgi:raffinose/stachyose/melibiose transport system permease protein